jgi:hypothetical protein
VRTLLGYSLFSVLLFSAAHCFGQSLTQGLTQGLTQNVAKSFAQDFKVGTAIGNITPTSVELQSGLYFMGGYGSWKDRGPATGIHDPLTARVICIEAGTAVCLVVIDSLGVPGPLAQQIKQAAAIKSGVPISNILVSATHTHAAPDLLGLWGGSPTDYRNRIVREVAGAVASAYRGRVSSTLAFAEGKGVAHNRRDWGFTDDNLGLMLIRDVNNTTVLGAVVFFAAHPVIAPMANRDISSDFVHSLRAKLSRTLRAPVIYFNGAIGDANPKRDRSDNYWSDAELYGEDLAKRAAMLMDQLEPIKPTLSIEHATLEVPVDNTVLAIANLFGIVEGNIAGPIWNRRSTSSLSHLRLGGSVSITTIPGEAVTRLGLAIKKMMPLRYQVLIGQTDDSLGYLIPEDEWQTDRNGNYEESVSLGKESAGRLLSALKPLMERAEQQKPDTIQE